MQNMERKNSLHAKYEKKTESAKKESNTNRAGQTAEQQIYTTTTNWNNKNDKCT